MSTPFLNQLASCNQSSGDLSYQDSKNSLSLASIRVHHGYTPAGIGGLAESTSKEVVVSWAFLPLLVVPEAAFRAAAKPAGRYLVLLSCCVSAEGFLSFYFRRLKMSVYPQRDLSVESRLEHGAEEVP